MSGKVGRAVPTTTLPVYRAIETAVNSSGKSNDISITNNGKVYNLPTRLVSNIADERDRHNRSTSLSDSAHCPHRRRPKCDDAACCIDDLLTAKCGCNRVGVLSAVGGTGARNRENVDLNNSNVPMKSGTRSSNLGQSAVTGCDPVKEEVSVGLLNACVLENHRDSRRV